ncbi:MAG: FtsW/RodA/SpoVE family cell cycle protein, partial [Gammaproteobacteria bacterium]
MKLRIETVKLGNFYLDPALLAAAFGLLIVGYVMVSSSSLHLGADMNDPLFYPLRQLEHIALGVFLAAGLMFVPLDFWRRVGPYAFFGGLALLVLVLIPGVGVRVNGSMRWLSAGGIRIQVSELVKLLSVIFMAGYITRHADHIRASAYGLLKPLGLFVAAGVLLLLEPDFGSAVVIVTIALGMMYLAG